MKLQMRTLLQILLPAVLVGSATAQVMTILPHGEKIGIGVPAHLPGPAGGLITGMKIELPAPRLNPGLTVTLAPTAAAAIMGAFPVLPIPRIPSRPIVPVLRTTAARENVAHPLALIYPGLRAQFIANLFDGRSAPVRPSRQIGLPEKDLEMEIGAY